MSLRTWRIAEFVAAAGLVALLVPQPSDARPRRGPPKPVEHYTFAPERVERQIEPFRATYPHVILVNELETRVTGGRSVCRLAWKGRRIDALPDDAESWRVELPLPRGAHVDEVRVFLVESNGRDGRSVDAVHEAVGDSLLVVDVDDLESAAVVDVAYTLSGEGVSVDEAFLFQPDVPVLASEYTFSVSRELWQDAVDAGLDWEFTAETSPRTWAPTRRDTPEFFTWTWREDTLVPVAEQRFTRDPKLVEVTGYLPAPALAQLDPSLLPEVERFDAIRDLEDLLRNQLDDGLGAYQNDPGRAGGAAADGIRIDLTPIRNK